MNVVEVNGLSLTLNKTEILKNISIDLKEGTIVGLVGRNGSGKTMLMKCICGFIQPTDGDIYVWGVHRNNRSDFPDNMGVIIETPGFVPYYSGFKNLKLLAGIKNLISDSEIKDCIRYVGLDPDSKKHVGKYSLGMRQRLGLAQAIMEKPNLLILDEPFNGLDVEGVEEMRNCLLELKKAGKTILIASHSKEDISVLCDEVYEMRHGEIYSTKDVGLQVGREEA